MSSTQEIDSKDAGAASSAKIDQKIEVTIFPVAEVDRAKEFYLRLGCGLLPTSHKKREDPCVPSSARQSHSDNQDN